MSELEVIITNTRPEHATQVPLVICAAYQMGDITPDECYDNYQIPSPQDVLKQIERFPEGQFVALLGEKVVGIAITLRVNHSPDAKPHRWLEAIGGLSIGNHDPNGEWLYGMEFSVHPAYQGHGIGVKLYEARFAMVKRLNLKGFYAGGMLMGYHRYKDSMTPREYGEAVMRREIKDPTVTMQMNRGFRAVAVIENYLEEELSGNAAMLIVWDNPDYTPQGH
jgi:GNAT superfamily N-acetyltransferase